jgi:hypothetical protein
LVGNLHGHDKVDANGVVLEGWGFNNIHYGVKIILHEGHDKYAQFVAQLQAIKHNMRKLCDGPGGSCMAQYTPSNLSLVVMWVSMPNLLHNFSDKE